MNETETEAQIPELHELRYSELMLLSATSVNTAGGAGEGGRNEERHNGNPRAREPQSSVCTGIPQCL
ncbi:hypothetical protein HS088_TW12G00054 [Tripterygium wilfordii]|uniref:Uncharacterized protein n=1 Tax=Tripterygium wilfordii TaxID=458696 RepID=A0A7J7CXP0_TRIWF|nr:hypothetical protein HS088_TW12G00054 [Tripterygium wilfordii]